MKECVQRHDVRHLTLRRHHLAGIDEAIPPHLIKRQARIDQAKSPAATDDPDVEREIVEEHGSVPVIRDSRIQACGF